ncbi:hypothetical protein TNCV_5081351 [Trichonephila clavipes]|nr:hypothetical protein TNCV_5081351 [Trichonephila clavipes]
MGMRIMPWTVNEKSYDSLPVPTQVQTRLVMNLILPGAPKSNRHSMDLVHAAYSYDTDAIDFPHHENPPTWAGNIAAEGQRQTNYATQPENYYSLY